MATTHPQISAQWHPTINGDLTPADVVAGSERRVWWKCDKGHEWQAPVYSRTRGLGCPICSGKKIVSGVNDLATLYPLIADQLDPNQNEKGLAARLSPYSPRSVYWLCERGHTYQMKVSAHVIWGRGCPYCAGRLVLPGYNDLATVAPLIAAQWHHELNGAATPETVTWGSNRKAWWICSSGHIWSARVSSRAGGSHSGCPICAGKSGIRSSLYMGIGKK